MVSGLCCGHRHVTPEVLGFCSSQTGISGTGMAKTAEMAFSSRLRHLKVAFASLSEVVSAFEVAGIGGASAVLLARNARTMAGTMPPCGEPWRQAKITLPQFSLPWTVAGVISRNDCYRNEGSSWRQLAMPHSRRRSTCQSTRSGWC